MTNEGLRQALDAKAKALNHGLLSECEGDISEALRRLSLACAWLTCTGQVERNKAKDRIREWVKAGSVSQAK